MPLQLMETGSGIKYSVSGVRDLTGEVSNAGVSANMSGTMNADVSDTAGAAKEAECKAVEIDDSMFVPPHLITFRIVKGVLEKDRVGEE